MAEITVATKFESVIAALKGEPAALTVEEMVEFIETRKAQAERKSKSKAAYKPSAETVERRETIEDYLAEVAVALTAGEIAEALGMTTSQVTGALSTLVKDGIVSAEKSANAKSAPKVYQYIAE